MQVYRKPVSKVPTNDGLRYDPTNRAPVEVNKTPLASQKQQPTTTKKKTIPDTEKSTQRATVTQPQTQTPKLPEFTAPESSRDAHRQYLYDPSTNAAYTNAMAALQNAKGEPPRFANTYGDQLDDLYMQIVGRDKFQYDLGSDVFYQQAAEQYANLGNMAMMDTIGQAAALTGGYNNSYAQSVGQQAYQGYLQQLNDNIPQYYQMALDAYNAEGDKLMNQYGLLSSLDQREYGQYQDDLNNYWANVNYLQGLADTEYQRGHDNWYNSLNMAMDVDNINYNRAVDAYNRGMDAYKTQRAEADANYDRLVNMMTTFGYEPTPEELATAGMTMEQGQVFMNYYNAQHPDAPSGGNPNNQDDPDDTETEFSYDDVKNAALGMVANYVGDAEVASYLQQAVAEGYITEEERQQILPLANNARNQNTTLYTKPSWLF